MRLLLLCGTAAVGKDTAAEILESLYGAQHLAQADMLKRLAEAFNFSRKQLYGASEFRNAPDPRFERGTYHWEITERAIKGDLGDAWLEALLPYATTHAGLDFARAMLHRWFDALRTRAYMVNQLSPRTVLQTLGTEFGRVVLGEDVWSLYALAEARRLITLDGAPLVVFTDGRFPNEVRNVRAQGGKILHIVDPSRAQLVGGVAGHVSESALDGFTDYDAEVVNGWIVEGKGPDGEPVPALKRDKGVYALDLARAVLPLFPGLRQINTLHLKEANHG